MTQPRGLMGAKAQHRANRWGDHRGKQFSRHAKSGGTVAKVEPVEPRGEKVGRNDPCPCGSGVKSKRCCKEETT